MAIEPAGYEGQGTGLQGKGGVELRVRIVEIQSLGSRLGVGIRMYYIVNNLHTRIRKW